MISHHVPILYLVQREVEGRLYYTFEFLAQAPNYLRHSIATVTIANSE